MKLRNKRLLRVISIGMALLLACMPCSALAEGLSAIVKSDVMYVAADANGSAILGSLPKNTVVNVLDYSGKVARISYNGYTGYARISDMKLLGTEVKTAVAGVSTRVFQKPDPKSKSIVIEAGTAMNVLATKGSVAMVEKNGIIGYTYLENLILGGTGQGLFQSGGEMNQGQLESLKDYLESQQIQQAQQTPKLSVATVAAMFKSGKYSNEQLCYIFLVNIMGYNTAAAAGVLANMNYESGFKTVIVGDGGTSYGLCQWHASRRTRLMDYCTEHGLKYTTLQGQLLYLKYELETFYPMVHNYLKDVSNTAEGAYDAGYYFCYNFENPADRENQSVKRAQSAQNTYFDRYATY